MPDESKEIGVIGVDSSGEPTIREPIFVKLSSYRNKNYLDIRKFYLDGDEWKPTKKGVTLSDDQFEELLKIFTDNKSSIIDHLNK